MTPAETGTHAAGDPGTRVATFGGVAVEEARDGPWMLAVQLRWSRPRIALVLGALALLAVLTNQPGWYVADARFEHFHDPWGFLLSHQWVWDDVRSLGTPQPYYSPAVGTLLTAFDWLGAGPALSERLLHATYLLVGAMGMVEVLRLFRPRIGPEHALAAAVFTFNPYTSQFLLPSGLFLHYALAPWLVTAAVRGVRGRDPWRWAAAFALAVFATGALNTATLVYTTTPLVPALAYVVFVERSAGARRLVAWIVRAGLLTLLASSAAVVHTVLNSPAIAENLATTELPETVSRTSSWSESWRGLGFWLTYFRTPGDALRPQVAGYFSRPDIVMATFAVPLVALVTATFARSRTRIVFLGTAALALVLMVGLHPVSDPSPLGRALDAGYDRWLGLRSFRSGYKAGVGWALGVSALFALGVSGAVRWAARPPRRHRRSWAAPSIAIVAIVTVGLASFPFWTGKLYPPDDRTKAVPEYWSDALDWLDAEPASGQVLVLPGSNRTRYRWGYVGDDIFDALLDRPHVARSSLSQGTAQAADLLVALDEWVTSPAFEQGSFGPVARRLGIRWIVIRNDLAWEELGAPRPASLDGVRRDPDLVRVQTFGAPGENTALPSDPVAAALGERALPPVEVFQVRGDVAEARLTASPTPLLVAGGGAAWTDLAGRGLLTSTGPVRYTADLSTADLLDALEAGAPLIVTDSNRRRVTQVTTDRNFASHTLAADEELARAPVELFDRPGSESVATFGAASRVTASSYGGPLATFPTWQRPGAAFDGDLSTAWITGALADPVGEELRIDFRRPVELGTVRLVAAPREGRRRVTAASLVFSDGEPVRVAFPGATRTVDLPPRPTRSLTIRIDGVEGSGNEGVGFAEVELPGVDVSERIRVPDDVFRRAATRPELAKAIENAPILYAFRRAIGNRDEPEESLIRRVFPVVGRRSFSVAGTLRFDETVSDQTLDALLDRPVGAFASSRRGRLPRNTASHLVDWDLDTGWEVSPVAGESATLRFPEQTVGHVDLYTASLRSDDTRYSRVTEAEIGFPAALGVATRVELDPDRPCERGADPRVCVQRHRVTVPATTTGRLTVELTAFNRVPGVLGNRPVRLVEVRPGFEGAPAFTRPAEALTGCRPLLDVDGVETAVRLEGTLRELTAGEPIPFVGCAGIELDTGAHRLETRPDLSPLFRSVSVAGGNLLDAVAEVPGDVEVLDRTPASTKLRVAAPEGGFLVAGRAFDSHWNASAPGFDLGDPVAADTLIGWPVPAGTFEIEVDYGPQRPYELALATSVGTVALALWLVIRRRRFR